MCVAIRSSPVRRMRVVAMLAALQARAMSSNCDHGNGSPGRSRPVRDNRFGQLRSREFEIEGASTYSLNKSFQLVVCLVLNTGKLECQ